MMLFKHTHLESNSMLSAQALCNPNWCSQSKGLYNLLKKERIGVGTICLGRFTFITSMYVHMDICVYGWMLIVRVCV